MASEASCERLFSLDLNPAPRTRNFPKWRAGLQARIIHVHVSPDPDHSKGIRPRSLEKGRGCLDFVHWNVFALFTLRSYLQCFQLAQAAN